MIDYIGNARVELAASIFGGFSCHFGSINGRTEGIIITILFLIGYGCCGIAGIMAYSNSPYKATAFVVIGICLVYNALTLGIGCPRV